MFVDQRLTRHVNGHSGRHVYLLKYAILETQVFLGITFKCEELSVDSLGHKYAAAVASTPAEFRVESPHNHHYLARLAVVHRNALP